jgi:hypothetical protein
MQAMERFRNLFLGIHGRINTRSELSIFLSQPCQLFLQVLVRLSLELSIITKEVNLALGFLGFSLGIGFSLIELAP